jgi:hypothetical protein
MVLRLGLLRLRQLLVSPQSPIDEPVLITAILSAIAEIA